MNDSILASVKAGIATMNYTAFDSELIQYINTFLSILNRIGVGTEGFIVTGDSETWDDFIGEGVWIPECETWLKLKVMQVFDTSASSVKAQALSESIAELTWYIDTAVKYGNGDTNV